MEIERWDPVAPSWLGHRPEPLIHERLWACPLVLGEDTRASRWAGVDATGLTIAMRVRDPAGSTTATPSSA